MFVEVQAELRLAQIVALLMQLQAQVQMNQAIAQAVWRVPDFFRVLAANDGRTSVAEVLADSAFRLVTLAVMKVPVVVMLLFVAACVSKFIIPTNALHFCLPLFRGFPAFFGVMCKITVILKLVRRCNRR